MDKSANLLNKIISWLITGLVFLTPLFFLPITTNFYSFNKNILLYFIVGLLLLAWAAKMVISKQMRLVKSSFGSPLTILTIAFILATLLSSPNKIDAFLTAGSTGSIIALTLLYFLIVNNLSRISKERLLYAVISSSAVLGLIAVYQYVGLGESWAPAAWMQSKLWTPAETPLILVTLLAISLPLTLFSFLKSFSKSTLLGAGLGLALILNALGLLITVFQILPGKPTSIVILPYSSAWAIGVEAFKQSPLFGVGPANFFSAFNRFRPAGFNGLDFWNSRFGASSSYPLQLLTTTGFLGLAGFALLALKLIRKIRASRKQPLAITFTVALLVFLFLPVGFSSLFVFYVLLAVWAEKTKESSFSLPATFSFIPLAIALLIVAPIFYLAGRAYTAEIVFRQSLVALTENRGTDAYNLQIRALELNPQKTNFRIAYSQTNFALANALASREDLSDQDRASISQLIQQAIREAKVATTLNPVNADAWENLAQLYRNLINFAQDADQWALAAYRQAILTDPVNPRLRINLGGLLFALGNFDQASRQFENAIDLKPDHANAYYNLATSYREQKRFVEAYQAMQITANLIPADSPDFEKVKNELNELAKQLPVPEASPSAQQQFPPEQTIVEPEPIPSPVISPIELPEESGPEVTPQPEPSPTP